ncbi:hypothetical protein K0504_11315 [Neiella marina]|uniref:SGNH hydrolase-type esterase domain-containing protein n=1 Tax=Neiella holothuriorum TaxID=2870530 RepID=A0ABS7EH02_9GAMM|nr:hypothetical protein [Neiella holothuriorum]MBW8191627.1 hypothetical protein [Neiella holothuriorum]
MRWLTLALVALVLAGYMLWNHCLQPSDKVIVKYAFTDLFEQQPQKNLMMGSSSIYRLQESQLACGSWLNRGIPNSQIKDLMVYLKLGTLQNAPENILLYAGENDLSQGRTVAQTYQSYLAVIERLKLDYRTATIHVIAVKLSPKRSAYWAKFQALNRLLRELSSTEPMLHVHEVSYPVSSYLSDGIHLSRAGYDVFLSKVNSACL